MPAVPEPAPVPTAPEPTEPAFAEPAPTGALPPVAAPALDPTDPEPALPAVLLPAPVEPELAPTEPPVEPGPSEPELIEEDPTFADAALIVPIEPCEPPAPAKSEVLLLLPVPAPPAALLLAAEPLPTFELLLPVELPAAFDDEPALCEPPEDPLPCEPPPADPPDCAPDALPVPPLLAPLAELPAPVADPLPLPAVVPPVVPTAPPAFVELPPAVELPEPAPDDAPPLVDAEPEPPPAATLSGWPTKRDSTIAAAISKTAMTAAAMTIRRRRRGCRPLPIRSPVCVWGRSESRAAVAIARLVPAVRKLLERAALLGARNVATRMRYLAPLAVCATLLTAQAPADRTTPAPTSSTECPDTAGATRKFLAGAAYDVRAPLGRLSVVPVTTEQSRARGLMCVVRVPPGKGMIFVFSPPGGPQSFWMKNTLIALDMVFVDADGTVTNVAADVPATPSGTTDDRIARRAGQGLYVIELGAGDAARHHIVSGSRLAIPTLNAQE